MRTIDLILTPYDKNKKITRKNTKTIYMEISNTMSLQSLCNIITLESTIKGKLFFHTGFRRGMIVYEPKVYHIQSNIKEYVMVEYEYAINVKINKKTTEYLEKIKFC